MSPQMASPSHPIKSCNSNSGPAHARTPRQPLVLVQLQRASPRGFERVYDVAIEPGAVARCATPREALRKGSPTPDLLEDCAPRCGGKGRPSPLHLLDACLPTPGVPSTVPVGVSSSNSSRASVHSSDFGKFAVTTSPGQQPQAKARPKVRTHGIEAEIGKDGCQPQAGHRGAGGGRPSHRKAAKTARLPSKQRPRSIEEDWDDLFGPPIENCGSGGSTVGTQRKTMKAPMSAGELKEVVEDVTYMEFGRGGLRPKNRSRQLRMRSHIQDLGQQMLQSMTTSFHRDVWAACHLPHPDEQREMEQLAMVVAKETESKQAMEQMRSLTLGRGMCSSRNLGSDEDRNPQAIPYRRERDDDPAALHQEKAIAWLARQSGWSVLDVEEVHDIFKQHAPDGAIGLHWHGHIFRALLQEVYPDICEEEMKRVIGEIRAVRRSTQRWRRQGQRVMYLTENPPEETKMVYFTEFYLGLVAWLESSAMKARDRSSCLLTRFFNKEDVEEKKPRTRELAGAFFRNLLKERKESFDQQQHQGDQEGFQSSFGQDSEDSAEGSEHDFDARPRLTTQRSVRCHSIPVVSVKTEDWLDD